MKTEKPTQVRPVWTKETVSKMGLLFLMYISQKVFLTFNWTLLPLVLRQQGVSLGGIGFTALVYSPWSLKFVHASLVDRFYSPRLGRRKSWIVPLLVTAWIILPFTAFLSPAKNLALILPLIFVLNLLFATVDIAVDGYATDILEPWERPWGNTMQMIGYMLGYMLGAGVFLVVYQQLGWRETILLIALLQFFLMLPVILHREMPPVGTGRDTPVDPAEKPPKPSVLRLLKQPKAMWFVIFLMIVTLFDRGGQQLRLPMFVDLGFAPRDLGHLNIWVGTPVSILGSLLGGYLLHRLGARRVYAAGCLAAAGISLFTALIWHGQSSSMVLVGALIGLDKLAVGLIMVLIYSMTMTLSAGPQSATNYAVLTSVGHLIGFMVMPLVGRVCDSVGYFNLFSTLAATGVLAVFAGDYLLRRRLAYSDT